MARRIILFSQPRSGSHLLERMLTAKQDNVKVLQHPLAGARGTQMQWLQRDDYNGGMAITERSAFEAAIEKGLNDWEEACKNGHQTLFTSCHAFFAVSPERMLECLSGIETQRGQPTAGNCTMIPNALLLRPETYPVFTIRDPRLVVPSAYRTMQKMGVPRGGGRANFLITTSLIWNQMLYDWYTAIGVEALVVDAEDYISNDADVFVKALCERLGMDGEKVRLGWEAEEKQKLHPMHYASQSTLIESNGVDARMGAKGRGWDAKMEMWEEEFRDDVKILKDMVHLTMQDYDYLRGKRFVVAI